MKSIVLAMVMSVVMTGSLLSGCGGSTSEVSEADAADEGVSVKEEAVQETEDSEEEIEITFSIIWNSIRISLIRWLLCTKKLNLM